MRQALLGHINDAALQALGLETLRGHAYHIVNDRWPLTLITTAMRNHPLDTQIQRTACGLFTNLIDCIEDSDIYEPIVDTLSEKEYICAALTAVRNHSGNGNVRFESFNFLSRFSGFTEGTYDSGTAYSNMIECGAVELILGVETVQNNGQSAAISVLASLIKTSADALNRAIENDAVSILIESVKNPYSGTRPRAHVHHDASSAFGSLLIGDTNDVFGSRIVNEGGLKLLIEGTLEDRSRS